MMTEYKPRTYGMMSERMEWAALVQDRDEFREEYERVSLINARLMASNNARQKIISDLLTQRAEYRKILDKIESGTSASEVFDFGQHLVPADDLASLRDDISLLEQANESLQRHFDQVKKDRVSISKTNEDLKQKLRYTEASRNDHRNCVAALESEKDEQTRHAKAYYNDLIIAHKWGNELEARLDEAQRELDKANQKHGRYVAKFDTAIAERDDERAALDQATSTIEELQEAIDLLTEPGQSSDRPCINCAPYKVQCRRLSDELTASRAEYQRMVEAKNEARASSDENFNAYKIVLKERNEQIKRWHGEERKHDELENTKKALRIAEGDRTFYMKRLAACYEKNGLPKGDSPKRAEASKYDGKRR